MNSFLRFFSILSLSAIVQSPCSAMECCSSQDDVDSGFRFQVYGEYLYWQAIQDHIQYAAVLNGGITAIVNQISDPHFNSLIDSGKVVDQHFKWSSGFRVGFGYASVSNPWDLDATYTRLHQHQKSHTNPSGHQILPLSIPASAIFGFISRGAATFELAKEAVSDWHFKYDVADVTIGRAVSIWNDFLFHPYVGVKGAWIEQKQTIKYLGYRLVTSTATPGITTPIFVQTTKRNGFRAVGPSLGFDNFWDIGRGFTLSSGLSGALVYGRLHIEEIPQVSSFPHLIQFTLEANKTHRLKPTVDGYIGLDWNGDIEGFGVTVGVSYEVQHWWNQWNAPASAVGVILTGGLPSSGDLSLHGLNAHLAVFF